MSAQGSDPVQPRSPHAPSSDIQLDARQRPDLPDPFALLTDFAVGNLSPAKHAIMSCALELNSDLAVQADFQTSVAASLLEEVRPVPLSPYLIGDTLERIVRRDADCPNLAANDHHVTHLDDRPRRAPKALRHLLGGTGLRDISWKSLVPGVAVHDVLGNRRTRDGDRLYLLRAKGGMSMPEHSHRGEEWSLILTGAYSVDGRTYRRGDLHIETETTHHAPQIEEGEDCICLVMVQGPLRMKRLLPKVVQQVVGI